MLALTPLPPGCVSSVSFSELLCDSTESYACMTHSLVSRVVVAGQAVQLPSYNRKRQEASRMPCPLGTMGKFKAAQTGNHHGHA
jgi:hypothetical protein